MSYFQMSHHHKGSESTIYRISTVSRFILLSELE